MSDLYLDVWSDQFPLEVLQFQAAAQGSSLGEQEHGDGMTATLVGDQIGIIAVDIGDGIKTIGETEVKAHLYTGITGTFKVTVKEAK